MDVKIRILLCTTYTQKKTQIEDKNLLTLEGLKDISSTNDD